MMSKEILRQLVALSNWLGDPAMDCAILGEGNTSARADENSFYVKASGQELRTIREEGFVQVAFDRILEMLKRGDLTDKAVKECLSAAKVDPSAPGHPSVETVLHALFLRLEGINFVGHTHPSAINALTCSKVFQEAFSGRIFPDEIVVCGPASVVVPYTDPGVPLARKVHELLNEFLDRYGEVPKVVVMQNHGFIALGHTAEQVENITLMATKAARILLGAYSTGGPRFMPQNEIDRIHTRPDEAYRRQRLALE